MASTTVASPIISLGLDASPLKKGLGEAQSAVASSVAGIQQSAQKLESTKFIPDVYALKPDTGTAGANVMDVVTRFNQRKAEETAKKAQDKTQAIDQKQIDGRLKEWNAKITPSASSLIPKELEGAFDLLLESEKTAKKHVEGLKGQLASVLAAGKQKLSAGWNSKITAGIWSGIDSSISGLGNLPATLSQMSMPLNQTLELAGKAQRILGAPARAMMAKEAGTDAVFYGGAALLESSSLSGTFARFERSVEDMFANIWNAVDKTFDVQGLIEGFRGGMAGISAIIEAAFGPIKIEDKNQDVLLAQFKAGANVVIETFDSIAKTSVSIYNSFFDIMKLIKNIPGLGGQGFTEKQEKLIKDYQIAHAETLPGGNGGMPPGFGWKMPDRVVELPRFKAIAEMRAKEILPAEIGRLGTEGIDAATKKAKETIEGIKLAPGPGADVEANARRALKEMTRGMAPTIDPMAVVQRNFEKRIEEIEAQFKKAKGAVKGEAGEARIAAESERDRGIVEVLQSVMKMNDQSKTSIAYEANSAALVESFMRAQAGTGEANAQDRIANAAEMQKTLMEQANTQLKELVNAVNKLPRNAAIMIAPIGGGGF